MTVTTTATTASGVVYDVAGRGPVDLLLLHGGSGRRQWFDAMAGLLADDFRMVRPDLPGHGDSPATPGSYRLEDSAAAAMEVLEDAGVSRCWVVGHSHGAHVGAVLAADRPDLVAGLVVGDAPMSRERMRGHQQGTAAMNRAWRELAGLPEWEVRERFLALEVAGPGSPTMAEVFGPDHPYVREMSVSLAHHDGDFLDAVLLRFDETYARLDDDLLRRIQGPVVLLQGDAAAGGLLTDADVDFVRERSPGATRHRLDGVGHGLQLQDPAQVAGALRRVLPA